jgi:alpha/beta superfamily hydrolase
VQVDLTGPAGRLEGLYEEPAGARFMAVVCHPHPLFGGTLHNHATYRLAKAVRESGGGSLRFNFRGVGRSQGAHSQGRGEVDDVRAALAWLAARRPDLPRYACGFSFGAWMALTAGCADPEVRGVLAAGFAPRSFDLGLVRHCSKPVAVVQAANDEFGPLDQVRLLLSGSGHPRRLAVVPNTTHLFGEDLPALQREAVAALAWLQESA